MTEEKFIATIEENQGILHKICRIYTHTKPEYEDLFQDILYQLWKSLPGYKGKSKLTTWIYQVALFTAITGLKKRKKREVATWYNSGEISYELDHENSNDELYAAIDKLSNTEKAVVVLYLDEKSYHEISEILGITESNVGARLTRARKRLANLLKK